MKRSVAAVILGVLALAGCASEEIVPNAPPDVLFKSAQAAVEDKSWESAKRYIDHLREEFPFSPLAVEAELLSADMLFKEELYQASIEGYANFVELHPFHEKTPYALYMKGVSHFNLIDTPDRDVTAARDTVNVMDRFVRANPKSSKVADAKVKMAMALDVLASHELYVAHYYVRKDKFEAAQNRLRGLLRDYPEASCREEAVKLLKEAEDKAAQVKKGG